MFLAAALKTGFATIGSAVGVGGAGAAATGAGIVGSVGQFALGLQQMSYQSSMLRQMAEQEEQNAKRMREIGQREAREQDIDAALQIENEIARMGASGFQLNSSSYLRRRNNLGKLAARDRQRLVEDAELQARNAQFRASANRSDAKNSKNFLGSFLELGLGINRSLVTGANLNSRTGTAGILNTARMQ